MMSSNYFLRYFNYGAYNILRQGELIKQLRPFLESKWSMKCTFLYYPKLPGETSKTVKATSLVCQTPTGPFQYIPTKYHQNIQYTHQMSSNYFDRYWSYGFYYPILQEEITKRLRCESSQFC